MVRSSIAVPTTGNHAGSIGVVRVNDDVNVHGQSASRDTDRLVGLIDQAAVRRAVPAVDGQPRQCRDHSFGVVGSARCVRGVGAPFRCVETCRLMLDNKSF